jgi:hypothetical protein
MSILHCIFKCIAHSGDETLINFASQQSISSSGAGAWQLINVPQNVFVSLSVLLVCLRGLRAAFLAPKSSFKVTSHKENHLAPFSLLFCRVSRFWAEQQRSWNADHVSLIHFISCQSMFILARHRIVRSRQR